MAWWFVSVGLVAAAAGADTPADVVEQRDQHAQHQVQGPRLRLEVSIPFYKDSTADKIYEDINSSNST